jgi:predicted RNA-binding Zn-ribbon protein involved in translation (DUF1610 family)
LQSLAYCPSRELVLGTRAYVCQVCTIYDPAKSNKRFADVYEESKSIAERKIREKLIALEEFELAAIKSDDEIDLSIDEFEEEEEEVPLKFEKRKAGKADLVDSEEFAEVECPFCGELFDDLQAHVQNCEFAPDDVSLDDIMPSKKKKKKKPGSLEGSSDQTKTEKQKCPYCGKEFLRLGRHSTSCSKRPDNADDKEDD